MLEYAHTHRKNTNTYKIIVIIIIVVVVPKLFKADNRIYVLESHIPVLKIYGKNVEC